MFCNVHGTVLSLLAFAKRPAAVEHFKLCKRQQVSQGFTGTSCNKIGSQSCMQQCLVLSSMAAARLGAGMSAGALRPQSAANIAREVPAATRSQRHVGREVSSFALKGVHGGLRARSGCYAARCAAREPCQAQCSRPHTSGCCQRQIPPDPARLSQLPADSKLLRPDGRSMCPGSR